MQRSDTRFLTTHTGSLIRPDSLVGEPAPDAEASTRADYERALRTAVADVVAEQRGVGLDVVNDGEFGKSSWSAYVLGRISGYEVRPDQLKPLDWLGRDRERFRGFFTANAEIPPALTGAPAEVCVGPIKYTGLDQVNRDLANLEAASAPYPGGEVFFTSVAPASTAYQGINEYYATEEEYIYAIADALRQEYLAIHEAGFLLQVDDAVLANMYDYLAAQGEETYQRWAQLRIEALNHALEGIPEDRIRYHVCFGSWHVPHVADAPLEALLPFILQVRAGAYSIEAANPRHEWEWEVWERAGVPDGKVLIPGVITHHTTTVEHPRLVAQRIERFAKIAGPEGVIAGADCGFAQAAAIKRTHPEVMWAKFESLVAGAQIASQRFWG
ncbi:MAG TPA: cobalamin-independent methionine synthase II family protein [Streptosporangiaceae bacterium]|nr:cobalamin-independent methionine synthase II family protein [Streptosporangiaceae bacterium]